MVLCDDAGDHPLRRRRARHRARRAAHARRPSPGDDGTAAALAADGAFGDPSRLVGAALVGPLNAGELVQEGTVTSVETAPSELELSFAIEASRAVGGTLRPGEVVDVLATFGAGGDTYTTTVVAGARVLRVDGDRGTQTIAVAVRSADDARAITHATNAGQVVVVRATASGDASRAGTYRAPSSRDDGQDGQDGP